MSTPTAVHVMADAKMRSAAAAAWATLEHNPDIGPLTGLLGRSRNADELPFEISVGPRRVSQLLTIIDDGPGDQGRSQRVRLAAQDHPDDGVEAVTFQVSMSEGRDGRSRLAVDMDAELIGWLSRVGRGAIADWLLLAVRDAAALLDSVVAAQAVDEVPWLKDHAQSPSTPPRSAPQQRAGNEHLVSLSTRTWLALGSGVAVGLGVGIVVGRTWGGRQQA